MKKENKQIKSKKLKNSKNFKEKEIKKVKIKEKDAKEKIITEADLIQTEINFEHYSIYKNLHQDPQDYMIAFNKIIDVMQRNTKYPVKFAYTIESYMTVKAVEKLGHMTTPKKLAGFLKIHVDTVLEHIEDNFLTHYPLKNKIYIPTADLAPYFKKLCH